MSTDMASGQNSIILCHNFTQASGNAALYAAALANILHCGLLMFHVVVLQLNPVEELPAVADGEALIREAEERLELAKMEILQQSGLPVPVHTQAVCGDFFAELQQLCRTVNPYAVVAGAGNSRKNTNHLCGNIHRYMMRYLAWSSVTIPACRCPAVIKKIGLACDFRGIIYELPLEEIKALTTQLQAELHVITIVKPEKSDPVVEFESGLLKHRLKGIAPCYHVIPDTDTVNAICEAVKHHQLNLLIVLPRQHPLWQRLFYKSEAEKIARHCPAPVMVIR